MEKEYNDIKDTVDETWAGESVKNIHGKVKFSDKKLKVHSKYDLSGDQGQAVDKLVKGLKEGIEYQTLKGVTGSGKTFTMAKIIEKMQRPTLILSHNKTLAAQLYREFKTFFPENAVEYYVSSYDYYQPEAYVPGKDLYIEKDASTNNELDRLKMSATFSLMERRDVIVVASVSCIFGLENPVSLQDMTHLYKVGNIFNHKVELEQLVRMLYERNDMVLEPGKFRVRGDIIEIFPPYLESAFRINLDWDEIKSLEWFDPLTGETQDTVEMYKLYPAKQFVMPKAEVDAAIGRIRSEMEDQCQYFRNVGKPVEEERIRSRVEYDLEMLQEVGYCGGIENYSRPLSNRKPGERPAVLLDYFPPDFMTFIDESHVSLPQIGAMYMGDHNRKLNLVDYGFRLPSALDNRPLKYEEFDKIVGQRIFVSATPGKIEKSLSTNMATQIIRPTGLLDPAITVKSTKGQMEDLYGEINKTTANKQRVFITTLTKKMAEDLTDFLLNKGIKARYLHSGIDTFQRVDILRDLRLGKFDVLVGINLLREGLDLPEVSLICILDADKIGFLRSATSLIQIIGRAARNVDGRVIMYADRVSDAMKEAIDETKFRREKQLEYNKKNNITPTSIVKAIDDILIHEKQEKKADANMDIDIRSKKYNMFSTKDKKKYVKELQKAMLECAENLEFEKATIYRDEIERVKKGELT